MISGRNLLPSFTHLSHPVLLYQMTMRLARLRRLRVPRHHMPQLMRLQQPPARLRPLRFLRIHQALQAARLTLTRTRTRTRTRTCTQINMPQPLVFPC